MNKQIEEMMKVVHSAETDYFHTMVTADIDDIIDGVASRDEIVATALYNAGYRKASDVAREIFERLYAHRKYDGHTVSVWLNDLICIAKEFGIDLRKYESEG